MIGSQRKSFLLRSVQQQHSYGSLVKSAVRGFAGGGAKKKAIAADTTDYDLVLVGKSLRFAADLKKVDQRLSRCRWSSLWRPWKVPAVEPAS